MPMTFRKLLLMLVMLALLPCPARADDDGHIIIRDTEIEETLRQWATPIWQAAGLNPNAVKLILIQSTDFNAFVAGGSNIFLYTGMIDKTKNPGEVLGVIAHETGHIAGGHLIRGREAMEHASYEAMLAMLLGLGAGAAGGGDAAGAIMRGGSGLALNAMLAHSRVQESSADQAGLRFLQESGYSPKGMETLLATLQDQELMPVSQQAAYMQTHPLTPDRLAAVEAKVKGSPYFDKPYPPAWNEEYARIKAKLTGFIEPERVGWVYSEKDTSTPALYARSIAAYRRSEKNKALTLIDTLIGREPKNPYFHELKGQMLRDFGQLADAAGEYRKAIAAKPNAALIRIDLAQVLVEMASDGNAALYAEAEKNLDEARTKEQHSTDIQRLYATIYGREGDDARANYHLAEEATLQNHIAQAQKLLDGALPGIKPGSKDWRAANDLKLYLDSRPKKDDRK